MTGDRLTEKHLKSGSSITKSNSRIYLEIIKKTTKESVKTGGVLATICNKKLLDATTVIYFFFIWRKSPPLPVGQGLFIHEVSRSHTTTHYSR